MSQKTILNIGDTVKYSERCAGVIEAIRVISSGNFIKQYEYEGNDEDVVLTLRGEYGVINFWLKDARISKTF